jgi:hypothetical protein
VILKEASACLRRRIGDSHGLAYSVNPLFSNTYGKSALTYHGIKKRLATMQGQPFSFHMEDMRFIAR